MDFQFVPSVRTACKPKMCYFKCRIKLLGGGRCTDGGCMCYVGFFNYDGSPVANYYPEDGYWWSLTELQRNAIRTETAKFQYVLLMTKTIFVTCT